MAKKEAKKEATKEVVVEEAKEEKTMLTMIDSQGRNWEIDEDGTLLRRI